MSTARQHAPVVDPVDVVGLGHVLVHAAQVGLPMPDAVHVAPDLGTRLDMRSIVELTEWSAYLEEQIHTEALNADVDLHSVSGEMLELPVRLICTVAYDPRVRLVPSYDPVAELLDRELDNRPAGRGYRP